MNNQDREVINIGEYEYDVTNFKHPGGNIIKYMTSGQDATQVFTEFHYRSKTANRILQSLPHKKRTAKIDDNGDSEMLVDFALFRKSLEDRGFFVPSYSHIIYRIIELFAMYSFAVYLIRYNIYASVVVFGLFGGRCGWLQHEG